MPEIVDKLAWKHGVSAEEVDQVLFGKAHFRKVQNGNYPGEDVSAAYGQTQAGRYLIVFFVYKQTKEALGLSSRDMEPHERRLYERR